MTVRQLFNLITDMIGHAEELLSFIALLFRMIHRAMDPNKPPMNHIVNFSPK